MNKVILAGRITKDPEIKYTASNIASCSFSLAIDRGIRDANGDKQTDFIQCVVWRHSAEYLGKYVSKGNMLLIEGKIQIRKYTNKEEQQVQVTEVVCDNVSNVSYGQASKETQGEEQEHKKTDITEDHLPF